MPDHYFPGATGIAMGHTGSGVMPRMERSVLSRPQEVPQPSLMEGAISRTQQCHSWASDLDAVADRVFGQTPEGAQKGTAPGSLADQLIESLDSLAERLAALSRRLGRLA